MQAEWDEAVGEMTPLAPSVEAAAVLDTGSDAVALTEAAAVLDGGSGAVALIAHHTATLPHELSQQALKRLQGHLQMALAGMSASSSTFSFRFQSVTAIATIRSRLWTFCNA